MAIYFFGAVIIALFFYVWRVLTPKKEQLLQVPDKWKLLLNEHVHFYQNLNPVQKAQFESDIKHFLGSVPINGAQVEVTLLDRLLVASSAVIPLFGFLLISGNGPIFEVPNPAAGENCLHFSIFDRKTESL